MCDSCSGKEKILKHLLSSAHTCYIVCARSAVKQQEVREGDHAQNTVSIIFLLCETKKGRAWNLWHKHVVFFKREGERIHAKSYYKNNNNSWQQAKLMMNFFLSKTKLSRTRNEMYKKSSEKAIIRSFCCHTMI